MYHILITDYRLPGPLSLVVTSEKGEQFLSQNLLFLHVIALSYYPTIAPFTNTANLSNTAFVNLQSTILAIPAILAILIHIIVLQVSCTALSLHPSSAA